MVDSGAEPAMLSRRATLPATIGRVESFFHRRFRRKQREIPVHPEVPTKEKEEGAPVPRGKPVECATDDVFRITLPQPRNVLRDRKGSQPTSKPLNLPEFDSLTAYLPLDEPENRECAKGIWRAEAERLVELGKNINRPLRFNDQVFFRKGDKCGYHDLSKLSQTILTAISLCSIDNECINVKHCPRLSNRDKLSKLIDQVQLTQGTDDDCEETTTEYLQANSDESIDAMVDLVNYVSAMLARLIMQTATGDFWKHNLLGVLTKFTAKLKILLLDIHTNSIIAVKAGQLALEKSVSKKVSFGSFTDEEECEEFLRMLDADAKAGLTSAEEAEVGAYCVDQNKFRGGINAAWNHILVSLRCLDRSGLPATAYEICCVAYETGFEGFKALLFQDRDLEYSASSDRDVLNTAHSAFCILHQTVCNIEDSGGSPPGSPESNGLTTTVEWAYADSSDPSCAPPGSDGFDPCDLSKLQRMEVALRFMDDIITIMVPLVMTSPIFVSNFTDFRTMMALSDPSGEVCSFQEGQFSAFFRMYTDQFEKIRPQRDTMHLLQAVRGGFFSRCSLMTGSSLKSTASAPPVNRKHKIVGRFHERIEEMNSWIIDENSVTVHCGLFVGSVIAGALLLAAGGLVIGFSVGERIHGVDPSNLATYLWVLATFIILVCKSALVENWAWNDFLHRRVRCRSVSELQAVTGINEQLIMAKLLHDECGGRGVLTTRGPYNSIFLKRSDDGFSIDRPLRTRTMLLSGLTLLKIVTPRGHALVCLDARRGTRLRVVGHQGLQNREYLAESSAAVMSELVAVNGGAAGEAMPPPTRRSRRPSSGNNSPERQFRAIRRAQSTSAAMTNMSQLRDMTIRMVPDSSDEEDSDSQDSHSPMSTPPRTPKTCDGPKNEPRGHFPFATRTVAFSSINGAPQPLSNDEKTIEYRTRGRAFSHSPSSTISEAYSSPTETVATSSSSISVNTTFQTFRDRVRQQSTSSSQGSPTSPPPAAMPSPATASAQISTNIYSTNIPKHKKKSSSKLYKQRTLKNQGSNGALSSIHTSEPSSNIRQPLTGDAGRILALMKELRGKMEGEVEYKIGDAPVWSTGVFLIVNETGRLVLVKEDGDHTTVVVDLRGCEVRTVGNRAEDTECTIEISTFHSRQDVKIKPPNTLQYDCWLASLLCWQPIHPAGPNNKMVKTQPVKLATDRKVERRRNSDATHSKDAAIIKVGKMAMWDCNNAASGSPSMTATVASKLPTRTSKTSGHSWRKISCILQENGEFKMYNETDVALLHVLQLSSLSRSAIQHLDPSVLGQDFCIGIYPNYSPHARFKAQVTPPIYISMETKILFEVWFVLLRAYTVPELYGPVGLTPSASSTPQSAPPSHSFEFSPTGTMTDAFRVPRMLNMRIVEAKLPGITSSNDDHRHQFGEKKDTEIFWELVIDSEVRARSMPRVINSTCLWMETFEFPELPSQLNLIEVVMKQRIVKHKRDRGPTTSNGSLTHHSMPAGEPIGVVTIDLQDLEFDTESEIWWPIMPASRNMDASLGEVMLKMQREEPIVLMMDEYKPLLDLLQNFSNGLTIQVGQVLSADLRRVAHTMLKIFQVSGKAIDWLMAIAESEIGALKGGESAAKKETPAPTADGEAQPPKPEAPKMDGKRAQMEANILFRGNSLLTKAVEAHMQRFGKEYMEETIAEHVQRVAEEDLLFEVDPMKCKSSDDLRQNWKMLNALVRGVWQSINNSAAKCPLEIKKVLNHVRTCVELKFGNMVEGPSYSSVSGFLFLRFLCPAIMNPKSFGILKDHPGSQAQRTLTLLAKSLQGLANMTTFGVKEPFMEPMNEFLLENTVDFKRFIDDVSLASPEIQQAVQVPPSYATPITIQARLQQASKEGFPSLPFLIDQPRAIGLLVQMWLKWDESQDGKPPQNFSPDLQHFHEICLHLKERMALCVGRAEEAERPSSSLSNRWEEVAEGLASSAALSPALATPGWDNNGSGQPPAKDSPTIGYLAMSSSGLLPPTKVFSPPFSASQHYTRGAGVSMMRNGSTSVGVLPEEQEGEGGAAGGGKKKLSNFVSGLKQKVKGEKE
ncbi:hypothetical protein Dda_8225 [Drechslerella dactyloides]|uniref:Ras-GAP domain-containing protein n=1 Tax=Drechslerella dactyloides TaxID=74499 RepID=A0AAD6NFA9_DREDA|nr:hypothetical protein Dda_8225 [Drechslerella dactyloides]